MSHGRLLFPALRWAPARGAYEPEGATLAEAFRVGVGGFILFGGTAEAAARLTTELRERAGRDLLIGADLERGAGQQFAGLTEWPPPRALGTLGLEAVRAAARSTAAEARQVGVNWVFAPVADLDLEPENPIVQSRAFGRDPGPVSECVAAWVEGAQAAGAFACAKHFPGHGRTRRDSHDTVPEVDAPAGLLAADLMPFRAAVQAGVSSVMTAHVRYPALDPSGAPATASAAIIRVLREELGFRGLVVTDALIMAGAQGLGPTAIIAAGSDALLYPPSLAAAHAALEDAERRGSLQPRQLQAALTRQAALLARLGLAADPPDPGLALDTADRLLAATPVRGTLPVLTGPLELAIVDDDLGGPYAPTPSHWVARALGERVGPGGSRVVLAFAEPRGWKGRAGFSPGARQALAEAIEGSALTVLFGHPRLLAELPGPGPVLLAWHRARPLQEAAARRLGRLLG